MIVSAGGLLGALAGGWWLGLALAQLAGPDRSAVDLAAAAIACGLLLLLGRTVQLHRPRSSLVAFALITALSALYGPALVW